MSAKVAKQVTEFSPAQFAAVQSVVSAPVQKDQAPLQTALERVTALAADPKAMLEGQYALVALIPSLLALTGDKKYAARTSSMSSEACLFSV